LHSIAGCGRPAGETWYNGIHQQHRRLDWNEAETQLSVASFLNLAALRAGENESGFRIKSGMTGFFFVSPGVGLGIARRSP
jgi:hypothetical protein